MNSNDDLMLGSKVRAVDGEELGELKEVRGEYFKVSGGLLSEDYWLSKECIALASDQDLKLRFAKDEIEQHKTSMPDAA